MCFFLDFTFKFFAMPFCFLSQHSAPHRAAGTRCDCNHVVLPKLIPGADVFLILLPFASAVWNLKSGECLRTLMHNSPVWAVRMNGSHVVSGGHRGLVKVWSAQTGALIKVSFLLGG